MQLQWNQKQFHYANVVALLFIFHGMWLYISIGGLKTLYYKEIVCWLDALGKAKIRNNNTSSSFSQLTSGWLHLKLNGRKVERKKYSQRKQCAQKRAQQFQDEWAKVNRWHEA